MKNFVCRKCGFANSLPDPTGVLVTCTRCQAPIDLNELSGDSGLTGGPVFESPSTSSPKLEATAPEVSVGGEIPWFLQATAEPSAPSSEEVAGTIDYELTNQPPSEEVPWFLQGSPELGTQAASPPPPTADPGSTAGPVESRAAASARSETERQGSAPPVEPVPAPVTVVPFSVEPRSLQKTELMHSGKPSHLDVEPAKNDTVEVPIPVSDLPQRNRHGIESRPAIGARKPRFDAANRKILVYGGGGLLGVAALVGLMLSVFSRNKNEDKADPNESIAKVDGSTKDGNPDETAPEGIAKRGEFKPEEIAERLIPSTVLIVTPGGLGSGVLIHRDPNVVLTNWHVVADAKNETPIVFFPDRDSSNKVIPRIDHYTTKSNLLGIPGKIVMHDPQRDIAIVELSRVPNSAVAIPLAGESAKQLERVFGIGQSGALDFGSLWQSNEGSCRQLVELPLKANAPGTSRVLLTSQPVNPGDSGGPVVNSRLELVGIVRAKASKFINLLEKNALKGVPVEGLDNFSLIIDVEELRAHLNDGFRLAFKRPFRNPSNYFARSDGPEGAIKKKSVEELVKIFESGTPQQVTLAMNEIVEYGGNAVPLLQKKLADPAQRGNWKNVLATLERIGNPAAVAVEPAIIALNDDFVENKIAAARFLGAIAPFGKKAVPDLWRNLRINDGRLRREIKTAIQIYGPYNKSDLDSLRRFAGIPAPMGKDTVNVPASSENNPFLKSYYIYLIAGMSDLTPTEFTNEVQRLNIFTDPDPRMREFMVDIINEIPSRFSRRDRFKCFIPLLGDNDEDVRKTARTVLEDMTVKNVKQREILYENGKPVFDVNDKEIPLDEGHRQANRYEINTKDFTYFVLTRRFKNGKEVTEKTTKVIKISKMRNTSRDEVDTLVEILQDPNTPTEGLIYALDLILHLGADAQVDFTLLTPLLSEKTQIDNKKETSLQVIDRTVRVMLSQRKPMTKMSKPLLKLCEHEQEWIRQDALWCLSWVYDNDEAILDTLYKGLEDGNPKIRDTAKDSLEQCLTTRDGRFTAEVELQLSIKTLGQSNQPVARMMAATVLGNAGARAKIASQTLIAALDDRDIEVRTAAVEALGKLGDAAQPGVEKIGELLLLDLDKDNALIDKMAIRAVLSNKEKLEIDDDVLLRLRRNHALRSASLRALAALKQHGAAALSSLGQFVNRTTDSEQLVIALGAIKSIIKNSDTKCDQVVIECINLFQNELSQADPGNKVTTPEKVIERLEHLLEANNRKRLPVSSAVIDMFKEIGPKALPGIRAYLASRIKRDNLTTDALQVMGSTESIIGLFSRDDVKIEQQMRADLTKILGAHTESHKNLQVRLKRNLATQLMSKQPTAKLEQDLRRELEILDRMIARLSYAQRVASKAQLVEKK